MVTSFLGIVLIAYSDESGGEDSFFGDIISFTGAITYGFFSV